MTMHNNIQHNNGKRSNLKIIESILIAAGSTGGSEGELKTHLMYKSSLSSNELTTYLKLLISYSLLDYHSDSRRFKVTSKGAKFLDIYYRMLQANLTGWLDNNSE